MKTKVCCKCHIRKSANKFAKRSGVSDGKGSWCKKCMRIYDKIRYSKKKVFLLKQKAEWKQQNLSKNKALMMQYLSHKHCVDCGEDDQVVFEFDHLGKKNKNISDMLGTYVWSTIKKEIAKCVIRCANCHRRKTAKEREFYKIWV